MPVSVRLDKETEELLEKASKLSGTSKSAVVKRSIKEYCIPLVKEKQKNPSDIIKELIKERPGSGRGNLSVRGEEILRDMLRKKHNDRR
jgi:Ribbon-helix-helix protein, copG family